MVKIVHMSLNHKLRSFAGVDSGIPIEGTTKHDKDSSQAKSYPSDV